MLLLIRSLRLAPRRLPSLLPLRAYSTPSSSLPRSAEWARGAPSDADPSTYLPADIKIPPPVRPANESVTIKRARLVYASRKRGILETDLILSTFARDHLAALSEAELNEYDVLLEENDWDIYYWVTEGRPAPTKVTDMTVFHKIVLHAKNTGRQILRMPDLA
ncbi:Flavinator of succinate dehydrogenase-domain-containing protein [Blyttiomyces helicus]|uniref:Succinate dehydrogenase assembly factor 2, mitochondrial n=1 Tax=Blyttiomyces helicus TaxID=388810 RepID=A0A4P9W9I5_9FUNG|nr:Flavinator of succinate dehydrogenase-domain-containing protein [Blyttiomyces helicus]|eukprot:RKO87460.1 Flavinator of succinate dehydrogenase-domain-containing protein [Blyttiomyces helicus]